MSGRTSCSRSNGPVNVPFVLLIGLREGQHEVRPDIKIGNSNFSCTGNARFQPRDFRRNAAPIIFHQEHKMPVRITKRDFPWHLKPKLRHFSASGFSETGQPWLNCHQLLASSRRSDARFCGASASHFDEIITHSPPHFSLFGPRYAFAARPVAGRFAPDRPRRARHAFF